MKTAIIMSNDSRHKVVVVNKGRRKEWYPTTTSRTRLERIARKAWVHAPWKVGGFWISHID